MHHHITEQSQQTWKIAVLLCAAYNNCFSTMASECFSDYTRTHVHTYTCTSRTCASVHLHWYTCTYWYAHRWRQNHGAIDYMMHVNTGCEDDDHTRFAMKNMEYPTLNQTTDGLWCCHAGTVVNRTVIKFMCSCLSIEYLFYSLFTNLSLNISYHREYSRHYMHLFEYGKK